MAVTVTITQYQAGEHESDIFMRDEVSDYAYDALIWCNRYNYTFASLLGLANNAEHTV